MENTVNTINLGTFAKGALAEQANVELQKVLENIMDPNTAAVKERSVTITLKIKPNQSRNGASVSIATKSTLAPVNAVFTDILIDKDLKTGEVKAIELGGQLPGQMAIEEEPVKQDGVIDLKAKKA